VAEQLSGLQKRVISAAELNCEVKCLINIITCATSGNILNPGKRAVLLDIPIRVQFCAIAYLIREILSKNA